MWFIRDEIDESSISYLLFKHEADYAELGMLCNGL